MVYKWCVVPQCTNTSVNNPLKMFVSVPTNPKRRKMWLQLARRDPKSFASHSNVFMCEDHFDVEKYIINYMKNKMGFSQKLILANDAVPTKFHCQEDRKRWLPDAGSFQEVFLKRQRIDLVTESLQSQSATETDVQKDYNMIQDTIEPEVQEMCDRAAGSVVVKQELQEDVPSLDSPETQQVDVGPLGLLLPVKFEPDTDECSVKQEIDIGPTVLYKPLSFPAPQLLDTVKYEVTLSDGTVSSGENISAEHQKIFGCNICKFRTTTKKQLKLHIRRHTGEKPYSCSYCKYKCSEKTKLNIHMRTHTGEKPYSCSYCKYKCPERSRLVNHMRTHTGEKPYSCSYCKYKCSDKSSLTKHRRTHTGEKPYSCSYCKYKSSIKSSLVKHMRTHTGEKPYSCSYCKYESTVNSSLVKHMRTHTGEKPYSCSYCNYKCAVKSSLVKHMPRHTGENP